MHMYSPAVGDCVPGSGSKHAQSLHVISAASEHWESGRLWWKSTRRQPKSESRSRDSFLVLKTVAMFCAKPAFLNF